MVGGVSWIEYPPQMVEPFWVALVCYGAAAPDKLHQGQHRGRAHRQEHRFGLACQFFGGGEVSPLCGDGGLRKLRGDRLPRLAGLARQACGFLGGGDGERFPREVNRCPRLGYERLGQ